MTVWAVQNHSTHAATLIVLSDNVFMYVFQYAKENIYLELNQEPRMCMTHMTPTASLGHLTSDVGLCRHMYIQSMVYVFVLYIAKLKHVQLQDYRES